MRFALHRCFIILYLLRLYHEKDGLLIQPLVDMWKRFVSIPNAERGAYFMNIREFEFFLQICKDGSFRKAAKSLFISPQGLGKAISNLESELQVQLLERQKNGIRLTEYGQAIKPYAEDIMKNIQEMKKEILLIDQQVSGTVNIACSYGAIEALGASLISNFEKKYPEIRVHLVEDTDIKVQQMVQEQQDFIGISVGPIDETKFHATYLKSHKLVWLINRRNALATKEEITFADLKDENLILYNEEYMTYHNVIACCAQEGFTPNILRLITEAIMAYKYASKYNALAITVDYIAEDIGTEKIVVKPINHPECLWNLYLISKANETPSKAQKAFASYIGELVPSKL